MELYGYCRDCGQGFFYERGGPHSRPVMRCPKHKREHELAANRARVAKCRAKKRAAQNSPNKRTGARRPRPVRGGEPMPEKPNIKKPRGNGLYAGEKEPTRSEKRAKLGLPTDD